MLYAESSAGARTRLEAFDGLERDPLPQSGPRLSREMRRMFGRGASRGTRSLARPQAPTGHLRSLLLPILVGPDGRPAGERRR